MKKINKTYYWIGLLLLFTAVLTLRYFGLFQELRKEFYYVIFGLWICMALLPLFGEIEFQLHPDHGSCCWIWSQFPVEYRAYAQRKNTAGECGYPDGHWTVVRVTW